MVAGKVIDARGAQHRFAFARNGPAAASAAFRQALVAAGVRADTPATVLCDGDAGLWHLQREVLPGATPVLDWWHVAVRFEHALQAARGLEAPLAGRAGRARPGAREVAPVARAPGGVPGQAHRPAALDRAQACA